MGKELIDRISYLLANEEDLFAKYRPDDIDAARLPALKVIIRGFQGAEHVMTELLFHRLTSSRLTQFSIPRSPRWVDFMVDQCKASANSPLPSL